ncbi:hypothetical protein [Haloechinothrix salitolerans]|uniref:Ribbon-helix-helix domain-containing protein n=1 Tax=Haloechinothrix salitolerans TaxID=926830 RepID=A0ABW2C4T4_9PSEU
MGVHKSLYVRDEEIALWQRAEQYAKAHRMPVSGLVMAALEAYLADDQDAQGQQDE